MSIDINYWIIYKYLKKKFKAMDSGDIKTELVISAITISDIHLEQTDDVKNKLVNEFRSMCKYCSLRECTGHFGIILFPRESCLSD